MTWLVTTGLTNAVLAALLAGLAYGVGRWAKRPALTHVLWVLVLVKLLTPPVFLFQVPVGFRIDPAVFRESPVAAAAIAPIPNPEPPAVVVGSVSAQDTQCEPASMLATKPPSVVCAPAAKPLPAKAVVSPLATIAGLFPSPANCLRAVLAVWITGSLWMAALYALRTWRFRTYLQLAARPDAELNERLAELAWKARLASHPAVVAVESTISPMLFGLGRRALLIFPAELNRQLDPAARDTLLLHELAHYARRDHWVRLIEMLAQIAFWWHPVVWWARRELEACEEECCDAWVVERHAGVPRLYAEALLATIDFLCDGPQPLPPAACGLGDVPFLKLRLTQIVKGRLATQLSPAAKVAVFLTAMFILPVFPSLFGGAAVASPGSERGEVASTESLTPIVVTTAESSAASTAPMMETSGTSELTPVISPTLAAINALMLPRRLPRLYGTAVSPDGRFRLEIREGYQATLLQAPIVNQSPETPINFLAEPLVKCAAFAPNSLSFVTGHDDSRARLYDSRSGRLNEQPLDGASAPIRSIMYNPAGTRVAAGTADGSVIIWDVATRDYSTILGPHPQGLAANCVRWSHDGSRLAISLGDSLESTDQGTLVICSADRGEVKGQFLLPSTAGAIDWLPRDESLVIADYNGQATVHRIDGLVQSQFTLDKDAVSAAQWSPNCSLVPFVSRATP